MTVLNGHVSPVTTILPFEVVGSKRKSSSSKKAGKRQTILVSASNAERSVRVWNLRDIENVSSLSLSSAADVMHISARAVPDHGDNVIISVVTTDGCLELFNTSLEGLVLIFLSMRIDHIGRD
jgi:WD40 repeat protein